MKAAVLKEYGRFSYQEADDPVPGDDQVLVKINYAGICGTDQHIFSGDFHPRTCLPFIPGHEFSGSVAATGKAVVNVKTGDKVTVDPIIWCGKCAACRMGHYPSCTSLRLLGIDMDGGFADYIAVDSAMVYKLPPGIKEEHAALIEILSIGFHACNRAGLAENDSVLIYGAGKVGQSILQAVKTKTSGRVFLVDILESRLERARSGYPDIIAINPVKDDPIAVIKETTKGEGVDVAFEAVGHASELKDRPHPVRACVQAIRGAGTVCVLGLADDPAPVIMKELIWKEAKIIASRVSHGEFADAIEQLARGALTPEILVTAVEPLSNIQAAFEQLEQHPEDHLKILLRI